MESEEKHVIDERPENRRKISIKIENLEDGTTSLIVNNPDQKTSTSNGTIIVGNRKPSERLFSKLEEDSKTVMEKLGSKVVPIPTESKKRNILSKSNVKAPIKKKNESPTRAKDIIEFEFSPIKKAPVTNTRDRSASPDPESEILDQLYEAAKKGDSGKLCDLIFSGKDGDETLQKDLGEKIEQIVKKHTDPDNPASNQNQAIVNLLKTKDAIEQKEQQRGRKRKRDLQVEKVVDFTNVKNTHKLGKVPDVSKLPPGVFETAPKRRKNPFRTPTPPNLPPTPFPVYKPKITVQNVLNSLGNAPVAVPLIPQQLHQPIAPKPTEEKNFIDYSVLTRALTKTLESKLKEGEDNDVKIVIFCNNKPIQSFSVRNNNKEGAKSVESEQTGPDNVVGSVPHPAVKDFTDRLLRMPMDSTLTNVDELISHGPAYLSKQLAQTLGLGGTNVPTIGDVKAILERNKRIASESMAKIQSNKIKSRRIPNEKLKALQEEFNSQISNKRTNVKNTKGTDKSDAGKSRDTENDLEERNLVINDSTVTTDENSNIENDFVRCDHCNRTFKQMRYLNRHIIRVHSSSLQASQGSEQTTLQNKATSETSSPKGRKSGAASLGKAPSATDASNSPANKSGMSPSKEASPSKSDQKVDEAVEEDKTVNDCEEVCVKTEPLSDSEDQEIQSLLADDKFIDLLETADKSEDALLNPDDQNDGAVDKGLNTNLKTTSYSYDYRPPISEEGLVEPVYVCEQCGKFYRARKTLKDHFLREHAKDKDDEPLYLYITGNKYQCPICFNNYHSGSELVSHTKKHTGELRSVCKLCGKVYSSVHVLRRHIDNIHSDVKPRPFQCELCDYAASNKWHLKEHYRRHTGEQPFKCPVCIKSFSHQGTMNRHCKTIHRLEIPSQRPIRNNVSDLPDLPLDGETTEYEEISGLDSNLMCSENSLPDSPEGETSGELDIDMSIVKTEAEEVDIDNF